jgi:hypothetical protein
VGKVSNFTTRVLTFGGIVLGYMDASAADNRVSDALKMITDTAAEICESVPLEQTASGNTLSADAQAKLGGLVGRIVGLGLSGTAQYHSERSTGVLQKDLASALQNSNNCKLNVFQTLERDLIGIDRSRTSTEPSPEVVFWQSIASSANRADFENYLRQFPRGQFASLAQNRLAVLTQPIRRYSYSVENPSGGGFPQQTVNVSLARYTDHSHADISVRNPWNNMVATKVDVYAVQNGHRAQASGTTSTATSEDIGTIRGQWQPGGTMSFSTDIPNYLIDDSSWDLAICIGNDSQCRSMGFGKDWKPPP